MRIADLVPASKKSKLKLEYGVLEVEYKPAALTSPYGSSEEIDEEDDSIENRNQLAEMLCAALISWDAEGPLPILPEPGLPVGSVVADGAAVPIDPEVVRYFPMPVLVGIQVALNADAMPDPKGMRNRSRRRG